MNTERIGDILIVSLPSRLDASNIAEVEQKFVDAVTTHKGKTLVDMGNVDFVASLALRMLLMSQKSLKQHDGEIVLCALQPQIAEIFRKSRFDTLFRIYPDREAALAAYA